MKCIQCSKDIGNKDAACWTCVEAICDQAVADEACDVDHDELTTSAADEIRARATRGRVLGTMSPAIADELEALAKDIEQGL